MNQQKRVVCYGDSNTYGYDPRGVLGGRYPDETLWTTLIQTDTRDVINEGQNGRMIPKFAWEKSEALQILAAHAPVDLAIVMLGTNDIINHWDFKAEDVAACMENCLTDLTAAMPDTRFLLIAPPPIQTGQLQMEPRLLVESQKFGECYRAAADRLNIAFADAADWQVEPAFDGVHFSEKGHAAFAKGLNQTLSQMGL